MGELVRSRFMGDGLSFGERGRFLGDLEFVSDGSRLIVPDSSEMAGFSFDVSSGSSCSRFIGVSSSLKDGGKGSGSGILGIGKSL